MEKTSAITTVSKCSVKPRCVALPQIVTFAVMEKERGQKEGIRKTKVTP